MRKAQVTQRVVRKAPLMFKCAFAWTPDASGTGRFFCSCVLWKLFLTGSRFAWRASANSTGCLSQSEDWSIKRNIFQKTTAKYINGRIKDTCSIILQYRDLGSRYMDLVLDIQVPKFMDHDCSMCKWSATHSLTNCDCKDQHFCKM